MLPLLGILAAAGAIGKIAGGAAQGKAAERSSQNNFTQTQDQQNLQRYATEQGARNNLLNLQENATMNRAQLGMQAPSVRAKQAVLGSLLQNMQAAKITPPAGVNMAQMSGGLTPAALSAAARAGGGELEKQALMALMTKSDVPAATDYVAQGTITPPSAGKYQDAGKLESILSTLGLIGAGAGGVGEAYGAYKGAGGPARRPAVPGYYGEDI